MMSPESVFKRIDYTVLLWALLGVLLFFLFLNSLNRGFNHDEFEAIHSAWKILQGERIYAEFHQNHHPFFYYLMAPVIALAGESTTTIIGLRIVVFLMLLLILAVTYLISKKVFNSETGVIALVLLCSTILFVEKAIEVRPDVPQALLGLVSVLLLLGYFKGGSWRHLALSAFALAVSFLFLQKAVFLGMVTTVLLLIALFYGHLSRRSFLLYSAVFFLTLAPYYLYLFFTGTLHSYYELAWLVNMRWPLQFLPFETLLRTFRWNLGLWMFYVPGLFLFVKDANHRRLGFLSFGLMVSVFLVRVPYPQYYMMALPLVAIISAHAFYSIVSDKRALLLVLVIAVSYPAVLISKEFLVEPNRAQLDRIEYVLSITDPGDTVYDGDIQFNLFRKDIDFFWFNVQPKTHGLATYQAMTGYYYNIYESIERFKPRVISNYYIENMYDPRIADHYIPGKYIGLYVRRRQRRD